MCFYLAQLTTLRRRNYLMWNEQLDLEYFSLARKKVGNKFVSVILYFLEVIKVIIECLVSTTWNFTVTSILD